MTEHLKMNNKKRYEVQLNEYIDYGDGEIKERLVETYKTNAVSAKKAISNIQFRTGLYDYNCVEELPGDGIRKLYFTAKELTKEEEKEKIREFKKNIFVKCNHCGYNNEKKRLKLFNACLNCHKPLASKDYFEKKLKEELSKCE